MAFGFLAREWERTCLACGYTWQVPRSIARHGIRGISTVGTSGLSARGMTCSASSNPRGYSDFNAGIEARAAQMEGFRTCAKCDADDFTPGVEVITTPGQTAGHQCVLVRGDGGDPATFDLLIGDAAYTPRIYADPASDHLPAGQASDVPVWRDSVRRIRSLGPERVHFCHHTDVVHR